MSSANASLRRVAVYCGSADGNHPAYRAEARALGEAIASAGLGLVYGGASVGLMGTVANAALDGGAEVIGVLPEVLADREIAHSGLTSLELVPTMHERKARMHELADAFIALPGGYGTLEELFEVLAWQTIKIHTKPIVLVNTNGFYDTMLTFLDHCLAEGMMTSQKREILLVANTVEEIFPLLGL